MNVRILATIGILFMTWGCDKKSPNIVGKWIGISPDREQITYHFKEDNTLIWTVDSQNEPFSTNAKYSIDYTTNPIQIDIYEFSFPPVKEFTFVGIIEFKGIDKLILYGEPSNTKDGVTTRPEKFGTDSVEFEKIE